MGVSVGLLAGYRGGWIDSVLMRTVDVLYGLPYILLVILFKIAFEGPLASLLHMVQPLDSLQQPRGSARRRQRISSCCFRRLAW